MRRWYKQNFSIVYVPSGVPSEIRRFMEDKARYENETGRAPSEEDMVKAFGISKGKIERLQKAINAKFVFSIDEPLFNDSKGFGANEKTMADSIEFQGDGPEEIAWKRELSLRIRKLLYLLPEEERNVLSLRYGIEDGEEKTLEKVGSILGYTRQRIEQIEKKGLKRLYSRIIFKTKDTPSL
jgi:RNA polymerase primary sigma factor